MIEGDEPDDRLKQASCLAAMAWFKKHRNESVDQFSSLWGSLANAQDPGGDESYVSISSEVTSNTSEECTASQAGPSGSAPAVKVARSDSQDGGQRRTVASSSTMEAAAFFLGLDHSTQARGITSWAVFLFLGVVFPIALLFYTSSYQSMALTVLSEVALASVAFDFVRSTSVSKARLPFLQLEAIAAEAISIQQSYKKDLKRAPQLFFFILIPTSALKLVQAIAWHLGVGFLAIDSSSLLRADLLAFPLLRTIAWSYRTGAYLFVCILFLLRTSLQTHRVQAYVDDLGDEVQIVKEHFKLRDQMAAISHQFRGFLLYSLLIICCSQASTLYTLLVMKSVELSQACWLLLSSFVQLTGAGMCLHGAAQITHRAQRIVSIVSQWHAVATCGHYVPPAAYSQPCSPHSFAGSSRFSYAWPREDSSLHDIRHLEGWGLKHPVQARRTDPCRGTIHPLKSAPSDGTAVDIDAIEHDARNFEANAFNKRQAIVTYLSTNPCGITMYGFALDRGFLYASFGFIFSIALFVVSRAISSR